MLKRGAIVGVMGSGSEPHKNLARPLGRLIASKGFHLLTGGGSGVMQEVSRGFCQGPRARGICIGIIKGSVQSDSSENPAREHLPSTVNPWVEIPIYTHLPYSGERGMDKLSRNHINVLSSDIMIVLPGGAGTRSEVLLRIQYGKRLILYLGEHNIDGYGPPYFSSQATEENQVLVARTLNDVDCLIDDLT